MTHSPLILFSNPYLLLFSSSQGLNRTRGQKWDPPAPYNPRWLFSGWTAYLSVIAHVLRTNLTSQRPLSLLNSLFSGWGLVVVYRLDLSASASWCCGPKLLATTSQDFPIGTDALLLWTSCIFRCILKVFPSYGIGVIVVFFSIAV